MARDEPLPEIDELILGHMDKVEELAEIMVALASLDELRYEACLHAWPPGPNDDDPLSEGLPWKPYSGSRWHEVEEAMWQLYATGITHKPSFIRVMAEEACAAGLAQMSKADTHD